MHFVPHLEIGDVLAGRYQILRVLGDGGMSRVYLASDLKLTGKIWAVKESISYSGIGVRMEEEASMLISLNHHRLPRIVDFIFPDAEGYSYMVMDFIEGVHLDQFVKEQEGRLHLEALIVYGLQICEGLHYLHSHHPPVVHRDLKPSNLLVDQDGELRFIDFGIARNYKENQSEDTVKLGTIGFAAPEQYGGRQSDGRSDLYSLGAVMMYLGTDCKFSEWSNEAIRVFEQNGYEVLRPIINKLLQFHPEDRYMSAAEVGNELRELRSQVMSKRQESKADNLRKKGEVTRCVVIAMAGASSGVGTTHTAITLANALFRIGNRVAVAELDPKSTAFQRISTIINGSDSSHSSIRQFRFAGVQYVRAPSRTELISLIADNFDCVICDLGSSRKKELIEEFVRADMAVIVGSGAEWRREDLVQFMDITREIPGRNLVCCIPLGTTSIIRELRRKLGIQRVHAIPLEMDPFDPGEETVKVLTSLYDELLHRPSNSRVKGLFLKRKRWKGND